MKAKIRGTLLVLLPLCLLAFLASQKVSCDREMKEIQEVQKMHELQELHEMQDNKVSDKWSLEVCQFPTPDFINEPISSLFLYREGGTAVIVGEKTYFFVRDGKKIFEYARDGRENYSWSSLYIKKTVGEEVHVYSIETGKKLLKWKPEGSQKLHSVTDKYLMFTDKNQFRTLKLETGEELPPITCPCNSEAMDVEILKDSLYVAWRAFSNGPKLCVRSWDLTTGKTHWTISVPCTGFDEGRWFTPFIRYESGAFHVSCLPHSFGYLAFNPLSGKILETWDGDYGKVEGVWNSNVIFLKNKQLFFYRLSDESRGEGTYDFSWWSPEEGKFSEFTTRKAYKIVSDGDALYMLSKGKVRRLVLSDGSLVVSGERQTEFPFQMSSRFKSSSHSIDGKTAFVFAVVNNQLKYLKIKHSDY